MVNNIYHILINFKSVDKCMLYTYPPIKQNVKQIKLNKRKKEIILTKPSHYKTNKFFVKM